MDTLKAIFVKALDMKFSSSGIQFNLFRELVTYYFPKIPDYEVSILFRESWCLGNGKVLVENFFTVLCERGHMIKSLNLPIPFKIPRFDPDLQSLYIDDMKDKHQLAC